MQEEVAAGGAQESRKGHPQWRGHQAKGPIIWAIVHAHAAALWQRSGATAVSSGAIFDVLSIILATPAATCLSGRA